MLFIALFAKPPANTPQAPRHLHPLDCLENCCFIKFLIELKLSFPRGEKGGNRTHQKLNANPHCVLAFRFVNSH